MLSSLSKFGASKNCLLSVPASHKIKFAPVSIWPEKFEEPLLNRKEIEEIRGTPEYERKASVPIKAADKNASCSLFRDPLITKFTNIVTEHSKAQVGENILLDTQRRIKEIQLMKYHAASEAKKADIELNPRVIIKQAIENVRPLMRLEKVKVGSVTYHVPTPISESRSYFEGMRWLHSCGRWERDTPHPDKQMLAHKHTKPRIPIGEGLAREILDAFYLTGKAINRKYEHHKQCEQNRAYAHYRRTK